MQYAGEARRASANDLWRTWLLTGVRRQAGDRRRIRGAHLGLKRMLIEGMPVSSEKPYTWKDFSDSMIRQAVGEAMQSMPPADAELVKLAYFGDLSNRDVALRTQSTEAAVERGLRRALDRISEHVRRGRGFAEKLLAAALAWLSGRWLSDHLPQLAPAGIVASALLAVSQPGAPAADQTAPTRPPRPAAVQMSATPALTRAVDAVSSSSAGSPIGPALGAPSSAQVPSVALPSAPLGPVVTVPQVTVPRVPVPQVSAPPVVRKTTSAVNTVTKKL